MDEQQSQIFSYLSPEARVRKDHPLRAIRAMVDEVLRQLSRRFDTMYARVGRPSIAPEKLLRAQLLQLLYSIRSERLLMEEMDYNLLFRWFVGLNADDAVWDATTFTKNRDRLLEADVAQEFLVRVVEQARGKGLTSDEHFTVDGTLIEAWASRRSFEPKPDPPAQGTGARGRKLLRDTHESKTDPEARLFKRSGAAEARPSYLGHVLTENRHGLVVEAMVTESGQKAEREAALSMLRKLRRRRPATLGADKAYQEERFIAALREQNITPHVAEYAPSKIWRNWLRKEEREQAGFTRSQQKRKLVEQVFGWIKVSAGMRRTKLKGRLRVDWMFRLAATAYNLVRMRRLLATAE